MNDGLFPKRRLSGRRLIWSQIWLLAWLLTGLQAFGSTWYVRPDGGSRYTQKRVENHLSAQCDGLADAPYPGSGTNRHCAFNDVRFLWGDATYNNNQTWVIAGGDTVILRGSLSSGVTWRVGWPNNRTGLDDKTQNYWGAAGDPYNSGAPAPPSGTVSAPTRILGENYGHCHADSARTQLHGGFGVSSVLRMSGASHVELACLDITDFSPCGRSAQTHACNTNPGMLDDYASSGIAWSNTSTHDTLTDVKIHGIAGSGMVGPTGDGTTFRFLSLLGNAAAGWNADSGDGTTGTGSLRVEHFDISWNGCAEQYPILSKLPYGDCTDDNAGGYGDGFGTATVASSPGWVAVFDQGVASYNTQDGLDALHLTGAGSSMTVSRTLAFGNMGQQIKVGGTAAILRGNTVFTNCNALRQDIPGTPAGYNSRLTDFCRAADTGVFVSVSDGSTTVYEGNTMYSASATGLQLGVYGSCGSPTCRIEMRNNTFVGFPKNKANGYPTEGTGENPGPIYIDDAEQVFLHPGSVFDHNTTFHGKKNWPCPNLHLHETAAICGNPHLADESWHLYGFGDISPTAATPSAPTIHKPAGSEGKGSSELQDPARQPAHRGGLAAVVALPAVLLAGWGGVRYLTRRSGTGPG